MAHGTQQTCDVIVVGAGASGMMCAPAAASGGRRVLLLDRNDAPGRKLNVTGGGKGNFSNRSISPADYAGENPDFCRSALARFGPDQAVEMLATAGIAVEEREHGQLFCLRSAKELTALLQRRCREAGCVFVPGVKALALRRLDGGARPEAPRFLLESGNGVYAARSLVLACGGPAWPQVGATETGFALARSMGHDIITPRPALTGLLMEKSWPLAGLAGLSVTVDMRLCGPWAAPAKGSRRNAPAGPVAAGLPLLFTHKGLSGPAALQASLYWRKGQELIVNFLPGLDLEGLLGAPGSGKLLCRNLVRRLLPDRLAEALLPPDLAGKQAARLSRAEREALKERLCAFLVRPTGVEGFAKAEVAAGGVSTAQVSSRSMESLLVPGLYFCGEVLDVTGRLGGYNLHWAFASGLAAGQALAREG